MQRPDRGFSFIEMLAVIVLMAVLCAAAGLSLMGVYGHASFDQTLARVIHYQQTACLLAQRFGLSGQLTITSSQMQLAWTHPPASLDAPTPLDLPADYHLQATTGAVAISAGGASNSYALCVQGPHRQQWLIVSGLTGQITLVDNETQVHDILALPASPRIDAH